MTKCLFALLEVRVLSSILWWYSCCNWVVLRPNTQLPSWIPNLSLWIPKQHTASLHLPLWCRKTNSNPPFDGSLQSQTVVQLECTVQIYLLITFLKLTAVIVMMGNVLVHHGIGILLQMPQPASYVICYLGCRATALFCCYSSLSKRLSCLSLRVLWLLFMQNLIRTRPTYKL